MQFMHQLKLATQSGAFTLSDKFRSGASNKALQGLDPPHYSGLQAIGLEKPAWVKSGLPVVCFSVADLHDHHDQLIVSDFIDDSINTLANPITLLTGKLLHAWRARVLRKRFNPGKQSL